MRIYSRKVKEIDPFAPEEDVTGLLGVKEEPKPTRKDLRWGLFGQKKRTSRKDGPKHARKISSGSAGSRLTVETRDSSYAGSDDIFDLTCIATNSDGSPITPIHHVILQQSNSREMREPSFEEAVIVETPSDKRDDSIINNYDINESHGLDCIVEETSSKDVSDFDRLSPRRNKLRKQAFDALPKATPDTQSKTWETNADRETINQGRLYSNVGGRRSTTFIPSEQKLTKDGFPEMILMDADTYSLNGNGSIWSDSNSSGVRTMDTLQRGLVCLQLGLADMQYTTAINDDVDFTYSEDSAEEIEAKPTLQGNDVSIRGLLDCTSQAKLVKRMNEMFPQESNPIKLLDGVVNTMNDEYSRALEMISSTKVEANDKLPTLLNNVAAAFTIQDQTSDAYFSDDDENEPTRAEI